MRGGEGSHQMRPVVRLPVYMYHVRGSGRRGGDVIRVMHGRRAWRGRSLVIPSSGFSAAVQSVTSEHHV